MKKKLLPLPPPQAFRPGFQLFDLPAMNWLCLDCHIKMLGLLSKAPNGGKCRSCGSKRLIDCNCVPLVATLSIEAVAGLPN